MFGWILNGVGSVAEKVGTAVNKNIRSLRVDKTEAEANIHQEQMAVLSQYAAEFAGRPPKNRWDSFVDGLNRLPRPLLTFGVIWIFAWAYISPGAFVDFCSVLEIIPEPLWMLFTLVVSLFFGGRFVKEDLARPKLTEEQRRKAIEIIEKRAAALKQPDIIIAVPSPEPIVTPDKLPDIPADKESSIAVDLMIASLIQREGGRVDHPADKGGPTNYGITLATLAAWRDKPTTKDDVWALGEEEASKIYKSQYYIAPGIDTLPRWLQAHVFDVSVNSGPRTAVRLLQRTLNSFGEQLRIDGIIGDMTRDACRKHDASSVNNALVAARIAFYDDIVAANPSQRVFLKGWRTRANSFTVSAEAA